MWREWGFAIPGTPLKTIKCSTLDVEPRDFPGCCRPVLRQQCAFLMIIRTLPGIVSPPATSLCVSHFFPEILGKSHGSMLKRSWLQIPAMWHGPIQALSCLDQASLHASLSRLNGALHTFRGTACIVFFKQEAFFHKCTTPSFYVPIFCPSSIDPFPRVMRHSGIHHGLTL